MSALQSRLEALAGAVRDKFNAIAPRLMPTGGTAGQVLTKNSSTNYDDAWADPSTGWTYLRLTADFSLSTTAGGTVTGLSFTPVVSADYEIESKMLVRSAATTTGPQVGVVLPNASVDHAFRITEPSAATTDTVQHIASNVFSGKNAALAWPTASVSYLVEVQGLFRSTTTVSGPIGITLAAEVAGSAVTIRAGSFLRYRRTA